MKFDIILGNQDSFKSYYNENNEKLERLQDSSNINILIGANNSGKSRFIRNLLKSESLFKENHSELINRINILNKLIDEMSFFGRNVNNDVRYKQFESNNKNIEFKKILNFKSVNEIENVIRFNEDLLASLNNGELINRIEIYENISEYDSDRLRACLKK